VARRLAGWQKVTVLPSGLFQPQAPRADTSIGPQWTMRRCRRVSMADLSSILWRERGLLDLLLFRLEVEQLLLASGRTCWLPIAAREIDMVLAEMREVELLRAVLVDTLAAEQHLHPNPSLQEIADSSPEPWRTIWLDHREAFTALTAQIAQVSQADREVRGDRLSGGVPTDSPRQGALT
jgi:hypothetical protein